MPTVVHQLFQPPARLPAQDSVTTEFLGSNPSAGNPISEVMSHDLLIAQSPPWKRRSSECLGIPRKGLPSSPQIDSA
ncbi:MAG: hypothetical protein K9N62_00690 [Verrucomicrobia bacterium]|nr:hypothetical protein [Verrucomicrobiota bacterium]